MTCMLLRNAQERLYVSKELQRSKEREAELREQLERIKTEAAGTAETTGAVYSFLHVCRFVWHAEFPNERVDGRFVCIYSPVL